MRRGELLTAIRIEPSGLDRDDDSLMLEFSKDPAASKLTLDPGTDPAQSE